MTHNDIRMDIGDIGERAVQRYFNSKRSDDWYDPEKDGTIDGKNYEVKTFRLNGGTNSFWISQNQTNTQWSKIDKVERLFFIMIPESLNETAKLMECHDHRNCWFKTKTNKGVPIRAYPISSCEFLSELSLEESNYLFENSKKISKHKRIPR